MRSKTTLLHPLLLALYPIVFLYSRNMDQLPLSAIFPPALLMLGFTLACWVLLSRRFQDSAKAAVAVSLLLLWFCSYGHIYEAIIVRKHIIEERLLLFLWSGLLIGGVLLFRKSRRSFQPLNTALGALALALLALPFSQIGLYTAQALRRPHRPAIMGSAANTEPAVTHCGVRPDIYYIVLDSYAGEQTLREFYNYDESPFLQGLRRRGFYIAAHSHSNYPFTNTSMPSALNMDYNDAISWRVGADCRDAAPLLAAIRDNAVMRFLRSQGYNCLTIDSPADLGQEDFGRLLLDTTLVGAMARLRETLCNIDVYDAAASRQRTLNAFDKLEHLPPCSQPRFVYAHILCPHPPYVFGPHGERVAHPLLNKTYPGQPGLKKLYLDQLAYAGSRAEELVDHLLAHSSKPPIIILQSDHGPLNLTSVWPPNASFANERFRILNAYYLPYGGKRIVYDTITPVNTYRLLFNYYFGAHYPRLKDESYCYSPQTPYRYIDITNKIQ